MSDSAPLVTIGLPVYNAAKHVMISVEDLLGQTFTNFELIISDNDSSDETGEICRAVAERDSRVRYFRQEFNVGIVENQNTVFRLARSKYFKWAASNDRCDAEFIAKCVDILERHDDVVLCYPRTELIDEEDRVLEEYEDNLHLTQDDPSIRFLKSLEFQGLNNPFNGLFRAEILKLGLPMGADFGCDLTMLSNLALYGKIYELPEFLFKRRIDENSHTSLRELKKDPETDDYLFGKYGSRNVQDFRTLKRFRRLFRAVRQSPLSWREKMRLRLVLIRQLAWKRNSLPGEIYHGVAHRFGGA